MTQILRVPILLLIFSFVASAAFGQNTTKPTITGQTPSPLTTPQATPITIELSNLVVSDPDPEPVFPNGFSIEVKGGKNYKVQGNVVTPDARFSGMLSVEVTVSDGKNKSDKFDLQVNVQRTQNEPPVITAQQPLSMNQGESLTIDFSNLSVDDPDNSYPNGFTLTLYGGKDYTFTGTTITPAANFSGKLTVPVTVNDGENESKRFDLKIDVTKKQNVAPQITDQQPLSVDQGGSLSIALGNLIVTDPDNSYPTGFTLKLFGGPNYSINGLTITPSANFSGQLTVPVSVNDGDKESNRFNLKIDVIKTQNVPPQITGQQPLNIDQGGSLTIELANLVVNDPDNNYPSGFTLTLYAGNDYAINGPTITPSADFSGKLTVPVTVNDGQAESNRFDLKIDVKKKKNVPPEITGQQPLSVTQGNNITIDLVSLIVTDPDNVFPADFTLKVFGGKDYTFNGTTVTPAANFSGQLTVPVSVNDGENDSKRFDLKIDVIKKQNVAPQITDQQALSITQGGSLAVILTNLTVTDPDNPYPAGFTLKLFAGSDYTFDGTTVTPSPAFTGQLTVPVTVNDGQNESNRFDLKIDVTTKPNVAPQITGQQALSMKQGTSLTIELANLIVADPDNNYPTGFTLKVYPGANYSFSSTTITPSVNFVGQLTVPVTVNDGQNESNRFDLKISVTNKPNVAPVITAQQALSVNQGAGITIDLNNLTVSDPDNNYPTGFTLKVLAGTNYSLAANTITPAPTFVGTLSVSVTVNDGTDDSNVFPLKVEVIKTQNTAPQISGQSPLSVNEDETITLSLGNLTVTDPDNTYPQGFTLKVNEGSNYTVIGATIKPAGNFSGELNVPVAVNDGSSDSAPFNLKITVLPVNDAPAITGQIPLTTNRNTLITIALSALTVKDADNNFPADFSLKILSGDNYSVAGNILTPAIDFIGTLTVAVMVNDGKANSPVFNLKIDVVSPDNAAPTITGQRQVRTSQHTPVTLQLSQLLVADPDNEYPHGFTLKVSPGAGYTLSGTAVTPDASITEGVFEVTVVVNDGQDDSAPFPLKIEVIPPAAKPRIISQKELIMPEDSTLTIRLTDLVVTDADNIDYPNGFTLAVSVSHEATYSKNGNSITPAADLNGFIEVGVTVSDGKNVSDEFRLAILVTPVNDPPEFIREDTTTLAYVPGHDPVSVFRTIEIKDVDDDHLVLAEVGFEGPNYIPASDLLTLADEHPAVRAVYDSAGRLFLIGYATVDEYLDALRTIEYNYLVTKDENGNLMDILDGARTVYLTVSDGHLASTTIRRKISMDVEILLNIPSAFSPNGDRENDTWHIDLLNADQVDGARITVFDKRGSVVYESVGLERDWDGSLNGRMLPVDTYYYTIDLNLSYTRKSYKGTVVVLY
ncbi:tandem-95 repeat protein [Chryseolinea sp. T2]|uniref:Ig-like domain-containing protein n=1 Tax=Chryseolinea sp. T2 TaxID=3129255 RepID=UPI003078935C